MRKMPEIEEEEIFDTWAIVELMWNGYKVTGHVRIAGRVTEENRLGVVLGRIDIPTGNAEQEEFVTQYFGGGSIYRLTPCDEATARAVAQENKSRPIEPYTLQMLLPKIEVKVQADGTETWGDYDKEEEMERVASSLWYDDEPQKVDPDDIKYDHEHDTHD